MFDQRSDTKHLIGSQRLDSEDRYRYHGNGFTDRIEHFQDVPFFGGTGLGGRQMLHHCGKISLAKSFFRDVPC